MLEYFVSGPEFTAQFEGQRHVGGVILVYFFTQVISRKEILYAYWFFVEKVYLLNNLVQVTQYVFFSGF